MVVVPRILDSQYCYGSRDRYFKDTHRVAKFLLLDYVGERITHT
jgi:hypothetical protein